jgi:hypothetical protein
MIVALAVLVPRLQGVSNIGSCHVGYVFNFITENGHNLMEKPIRVGRDIARLWKMGLVHGRRNNFGPSFGAYDDWPNIVTHAPAPHN